MKKIIVTESQYKKLISINEESQSQPKIQGGGSNPLDRVNNFAKKTFKTADIRNLEPNDALMEEPDIDNRKSSSSDGKKFDIRKNVQFTNPPIPNNRMTRTPERKPVNEDIFSPEVHEGVKELIEFIWLNPSQEGLSTFFVRNGLNWGDIISYLTSVGVVAGLGGGTYKVINYFKRVFSKNSKKAAEEKKEEIEKIAKEIENNPDAPWNQIEKQEEPSEETPWERKVRLQKKPDSGWKATPKGFNPNQHRPWANEGEDESHTSDFTTFYEGKELNLLNGPDGMYVSDHSDDVDNITIGSGLKDFNEGVNLVKIDEELKEELRKLYEKDYEFISNLKNLEEMTSTATVGAGFTGPLGAAGKPNISPDYTPAKQIEIINDEEELYGTKVSEERHQKMSDKIVTKISQSVNRGKKSTTDDLRAQHYEPDRTRANYPLTNDDLPLDKFLKAKADGNIKEDTIEEDTTTASIPGYVGPKIWAKDKANWVAAHRTQYPEGEIVDFDPCTKLNNNKAAQSGKCSQGAVDHVVKTHKTKDSVISKGMYEAIAKKTGRTVEDVKRIIESKTKNTKPL